MLRRMQGSEDLRQYVGENQGGRRQRLKIYVHTTH
jgi:hypothetical protein